MDGEVEQALNAQSELIAALRVRIEDLEVRLGDRWLVIPEPVADQE